MSDLPDPTEATVLAAVVDDLDAGFADLVRAYQRTVYSVALRLGGSGHDAEDLSAECFLRAYKAVRDYDKERILGLRPRAWLLTILLNTWRNTLRTASRRPVTTGAEVPDRPAGGPSVLDRVEAAETSAELAAALAALPERQRVAVVLRHVVDLPFAEVAAVLGVPEGTAKSHVSRGLARLRETHRKEAP